MKGLMYREMHVSDRFMHRGVKPQVHLGQEHAF